MAKNNNIGLILSAAEISDKILGVYPKNDFYTVWPLGGRVTQQLDRIKAYFPNAVLGDLAKRLNITADRIAHELLNIDIQALAHGNDRPCWDASLISDLSPYSGDLQVNAARFLVLHEILSSGGKHIFFIDGVELGLVLEKAGIRNHLPVKWLGPKPRQYFGYQALRARASVLKYFWKHKSILQNYRKKKQIPWQALKACDILIVDWAEENTFNSDRPNKMARSLARMPDILRKAGLKVGFIANPISWTQDFGKIAINICDAFDPVITIDECRSFPSMISSAWKTWKMNINLRKKICISGINISDIFELERMRDLCGTQSTVAYSCRQIASILSRNGLKPKAIVFPHEHQGWERALMAGVREFLPNTRIIGYQVAPFSKRYIGLYPSKTDVRDGKTPDQLILMGKWYKEIFKDKGYPEDSMCVAGSLRFEKSIEIFDVDAGAEIDNDGKYILVSTSIDQNESIHLIEKAIEILKEFSGVEIVVNFHPVIDESLKYEIKGLTKENSGNDFSRIRFSDDRIGKLINGAYVLLYNNSGAVFDAKFKGVPVVYIGVEGRLCYDKIPDHLSCRVNNSEELFTALRQIIFSKRRHAADYSVGGCFERVNESAIVKAILGQ